MHIVSTKDAASHGIKALVYGPAGAGKTRLCATTGDTEHTLILSAEAGLLSLREYDIDVVVIRSLADLREALAALRAMLAGEADALPKRYTWVCIDSLSEIAEVVLAKEKAENTNGMRAYGEMADVMFKVIRAFRDLSGINVLFTAKIERVDDGGRLLFSPSLPGKQLTQGIAYLFDEVFAMRTSTDEGTGEVRRFLQTVNDGVYEGKDRSGALAAVEAANIERIAKKINKNNNKGE